jgi:OmpA-OmpF porin, OOP family
LNSEVLGGLKWRLPHAEFIETGIAAGPGIASGIGTPSFRGAFQIAFTPVIPPPKVDTDHDGIYDDVDACPTVPGKRNADPRKNGCPELDRDHDGILDDVDACPDVPGVASADPKKNGCPILDTDHDGIPDDVDACPTEPGIANADPKKNGCPFRDKDGDGIEDDVDACIDIPGVATNDPATNGCPPDSDGDGFRDDVDACPHEKGVDNKDPSKRGCPRLVVFTDSEVKILEQVQFDFGKATIRSASDELLDEVAQVLKDHLEVVKLEVQGHTDHVGPAQYNKKLSEDRAKSVMAALVKRGLDQTRLTATGYGFDKPIGDNKTPEGRQMNRRVQFIVTEKKAIPVITTKQGVTPPPTRVP